MTTAASKYLTEEYGSNDFNFPYIQVVRGEIDLSHCGYFIPLAQAEKAGWEHLNPAHLTEYTYNNGKTEIGCLIKKPRMLICAVYRLGAFDRRASQENDTFTIVGDWKEEHRHDPNIGNFQIYLVIFLDKNNQPLHEIPFKLIAKGAHQGSLSQQWQQFCTQISRLQAKALKVPFRPRNEQYNALCIFQPILTRESVGGKIKSPTCYVSDYVRPTELNWAQFFLGTNEVLADGVIEILNPQPRKFLKPVLMSGMDAAAEDAIEPEFIQSTPAPALLAEPNPHQDAIEVDAVESVAEPTVTRSDLTPADFDDAEEDRIPF
jgi:hypothetical protein